jgi:hypothetical protein
MSADVKAGPIVYGRRRGDGPRRLDRHISR